MEGLFLEILNMSIAASWLILAVIVIRAFMGKVPKGLRYVLWALVAVRLLCPLSIESALSMIPSAETFSEESMYSDSPQINSGVTIIDDAVNPILTGQTNSDVDENQTINQNDNAGNLNLGNGMISDGEGNDSVSDETGNSISSNAGNVLTSENEISMQSIIHIVSWVWIIGIVVMLAYSFISFIRLHNTIKASLHMRDNLWLCDEIQSPFIFGVARPRIYLPSHIEKGQIPYIEAHENEHLRFHDHWWKPLGFAILALHWFNPLVWLAYVLLCRDIELACDERVIQRMDGEEKKKYSKSLLLCSNPRHIISACPVAFGEIGVKERVKSILDYKKPSTWIVGIGVLVCIIVAICFMTNPNKDAVLDKIEGVAKIELMSGNTGKVVVITDAEDIARITNNVNEMTFVQGMSTVGTGGWSYWLKWYDAEGNQIETLMITGEDSYRGDDYFYHSTKGAFDIAFYEELLAKAETTADGSLTQAELEWFGTEFFNNNDENLIPNMFLSSEYDRPENIDLYALFYSGDLDADREEPTQEEIELLKTYYPSIDTTFIVKISAEKMDEILSKYMDISLDETNKVGLDQFYYLEEYDAYYNIAADVWSQEILIERGWRNVEEGTITLQYYLGYGNDENGTRYHITLKEDNNGYYFISHKKVEDSISNNLSEEELVWLQEKLSWFETEFFNSEENLMPNMFLAREFDCPENIDLGNTFHGGADGRGGGEISAQEESLLLDQYYDEELLDVSRTTADEMDAILMEYMGITLADTNKVNLDSLYYLEEYDAYYNVAGDTEYGKYDLLSAWVNEDGTISIQYKDAFEEPTDTYVVTLKEVGETYHFVSNVKIEYSETLQ